jgi:hypothetical protein
LVGSLYHFFPIEEAFTQALIRRHAGIVDEAFARVDDRVASIGL